jgi:uncharacterized membrane protein YfcA
MTGVLPAVAHLNPGRDILLVLAGIGAGIFNGVAGGGTLITFPTMLAMGFPALNANMTCTVAILPTYVGGLAGFRVEIRAQRGHLRSLLPVALVGSVVGAVLLLTTSVSDFERIAPWLVLLAAGLFAAQPILVRALSGIANDHPTRRALLFGGLFLASIYGGYFGAGLGVIMLAVLGLALPDTLIRTSGLRTILSVGVNGIAALAFIVHGSVSWTAAAWLALGGLVGGWLGARVALHLPAMALRVVVVAIGLATGIRLLVG